MPFPQVSLFTAEALLRCYEWSKERLLDAWMEDPAACCDKAGVALPAKLSVDNLEDPACVKGGVEREECSICTLLCVQEVMVPCEHVFCKSCWQQ